MLSKLGSYELCSFCDMPTYVVYSKIKFLLKCPFSLFPFSSLSLFLLISPKDQKNLRLNPGEAQNKGSLCWISPSHWLDYSLGNSQKTEPPVRAGSPGMGGPGALRHEPCPWTWPPSRCRSSRWPRQARGTQLVPSAGPPGAGCHQRSSGPASWGEKVEPGSTLASSLHFIAHMSCRRQQSPACRLSSKVLPALFTQTHEALLCPETGVGEKEGKYKLFPGKFALGGWVSI